MLDARAKGKGRTRNRVVNGGDNVTSGAGCRPDWRCPMCMYVRGATTTAALLGVRCAFILQSRE